MTPSPIRAAQLAAPRQQRNWDWRAAANFVCGGTGGGLLLVAAVAGVEGAARQAALLTGLALIGCGLTCVWFEIGRPWRALNVYRHAATSWMTREAFVALAVFGSGILALYFMAAVPLLLAGACGGVFLYSQARILAANKGIPVWRHPASVPLMVATGLAEGAGVLLTLALLAGSASTGMLSGFMVALVVLRAWRWHRYLDGIERAGAPLAALKVLREFGPRFLWFGHVAPALLALGVLAGLPGAVAMATTAGVLVVGSGWALKYSLVRRAAYTQGLAIDHLPARGRGPAGPGVKPGWTTLARG